MKPITAEEVRAIREETGMGMHEARMEAMRRHALRCMNSPFWFLHLRTVRDIIKFLIENAR